MSDQQPESRREFAPTGERTDWRCALRFRAPRCGIGLALFVALFTAVLWAGSNDDVDCTMGGYPLGESNPCFDQGWGHGSGWRLVFGTVSVAAVLIALGCVGVVVRQRRRKGSGPRSS